MVLRQIFKMPLHRLAACVALGGVVVQSFGSYVKFRMTENIAYTDAYKDAISLTKTHPGTEHLFGKPIYSKGLDAAN